MNLQKFFEEINQSNQETKFTKLLVTLA